MYYYHTGTTGLISVPQLELTAKATANGQVGQVFAGPLFLKVKTKFNFTNTNTKKVLR